MPAAPHELWGILRATQRVPGQPAPAGLLGWAFRPRNFMKSHRPWGRQFCLRTRFQRVQPPARRHACRVPTRGDALEIGHSRRESGAARFSQAEPPAPPSRAACLALVGHALACQASEVRPRVPTRGDAVVESSPSRHGSRYPWRNASQLQAAISRLRTLADSVVRFRRSMSAAACLFPPVFRSACSRMLRSIPASVCS